VRKTDNRHFSNRSTFLSYFMSCCCNFMSVILRPFASPPP